jgi:tetratricopeptide (TPR) repeat protein
MQLNTKKNPRPLLEIYSSDSDLFQLDSLFARAQYYLDGGNYSLAERLFERCLEMDDHHFWGLMGLAKTSELTDHPARAAEFYLRALNSTNEPASQAYAACGRANVLGRLGRVDEAVETYEQSITIEPGYIYAYTGLALLLEALLPPPYEKIVGLYRKVLEIEPASATWTWCTKNLAEAEAALTREAAGIKQPNISGKASDIQLLCLFGQHRLIELMEIHLLDQTPPYGRVLQQVFVELKKMPPGHFAAIEDFYTYVADRLAGDPDTDSLPSPDNMMLAKRFYELALAENKPLPASGYIRFLRNFLRQHEFTRAREAVIRAVIDAGDDPTVLVTAADVMKAIDRHGVARLLLGRAMELAPDAVAAAIARSGEEAEPDTAWLELTAVLDRANQANAGKFGTVEKWLEAEGAQAQLLARHRDDPAEGSAKQRKVLDDVDAWLAEFFRLLGDHSAVLLFDLPHYRAQGNTWFEGMDPALVHYFEKGWWEGRSVHAAFDDDHVRHQLRLHGLDSTSEPLLLLFLRHENALGLSPNVLFDAALYRAGAGLAADTSPWLHYLSGGWRTNERVSPYFDTDYFTLRTHRNSIEASLPPLLRYFCKDPMGDANRLFHAAYYAERYKESLRGKAPLAHYLSEGAYVGFAPNPFFQTEGRTARERIDYLQLPPAGA